MAELIFERILKLSNDLKVNDEFEISGFHVKIIKIATNKHDDLVLHLWIIGAAIKRRSEMMLILPKKVPVITLKR